MRAHVLSEADLRLAPVLGSAKRRDARRAALHPQPGGADWSACIKVHQVRLPFNLTRVEVLAFFEWANSSVICGRSLLTDTGSILICFLVSLSVNR